MPIDKIPVLHYEFTWEGYHVCLSKERDIFRMKPATWSIVYIDTRSVRIQHPLIIPSYTKKDEIISFVKGWLTMRGIEATRAALEAKAVRESCLTLQEDIAILDAENAETLSDLPENAEEWEIMEKRSTRPTTRELYTELVEPEFKFD